MSRLQQERYCDAIRLREHRRPHPSSNPRRGRVIKRRICALRRLALGVRAESAGRDRFASLPGWLFTSVAMKQDTVSAGRGGDMVIVGTDCLISGGWPRIL
jgi:hypothetical protein